MTMIQRFGSQYTQYTQAGQHQRTESEERDLKATIKGSFSAGLRRASDLAKEARQLEMTDKEAARAKKEESRAATKNLTDFIKARPKTR